MIDYGFYKELDYTFEQTIKIVLEKIKNSEFNVITQIDLKKKFKEKLGRNYKEYLILGLCDTENAFQVVEAENNIGLMLPCNLIVYEKVDKTVIAIMKPSAMMASMDNLELEADLPYEDEYAIACLSPYSFYHG